MSEQKAVMRDCRDGPSFGPVHPKKDLTLINEDLFVALAKILGIEKEQAQQSIDFLAISFHDGADLLLLLAGPYEDSRAERGDHGSGCGEGRNVQEGTYAAVGSAPSTSYRRQSITATTSADKVRVASSDVIYHPCGAHRACAENEKCIERRLSNGDRQYVCRDC